MTPSQQAKQYGIKLSDVILVSTFPRQTLRDMFYNHPMKFRAVCLGCVVIKEEE